MKRFLLILLILLIPAAVYASDISWSPSVSAYLGYRGDAYTAGSGDRFYSSFNAGVKGSLLAMEIGNHRVSLPATVAYSTASAYISGSIRNPSLDISLEAEYGYRLSELILLSIGAGFKAEWYYNANAAAISYGATFTPSFFVSENFTIDGMLSMYGGRNGFSMIVGAGATFRFSAGGEDA